MSQGLAAEFEARGPWVTRFWIDGIPYGGVYDPAADARIRHFRSQFRSADRILDLGCLEGGFSILLADVADEVVGIDARERNLEKARWIAKLHGVRNVEFLQADLESFDFAGLGDFEVVFNVGLLYHLRQPWNLLRRLRERSETMFLWTHIAPIEATLVERGGYYGVEYGEHGIDDPLSGLDSLSFWPTLGELRRMLDEAGFGRLRTLKVDASHIHGPAVTMVARARSRPIFSWPAKALHRAARLVQGKGVVR